MDYQAKTLFEGGWKRYNKAEMGFEYLTTGRKTIRANGERDRERAQDAMKAVG